MDITLYFLSRTLDEYVSNVNTCRAHGARIFFEYHRGGPSVVINTPRGKNRIHLSRARRLAITFLSVSKFSLRFDLAQWTRMRRELAQKIGNFRSTCTVFDSVLFFSCPSLLFRSQLHKCALWTDRLLGANTSDDQEGKQTVLNGICWFWFG